MANWKRELLSWLIALVGLPVFFVLILEFGLRVFGIGHNPSVFVEEDGRARTNWSFTFKYFPWSMARPMPPVQFSVEKPEETLRIFVLGGSAAQGFPVEDFGIANQMEAILSEAMPDRDIEVVNTAITAVNSHVMLPIAEACLKYDPNYLVVYVGNNEVVGPHGAGTVFSGFNRNLSLIRLGDEIRGYRLSQLIKILSGRHKSPTGTWMGMEQFLKNALPENDQRLETVYAHYQRNLEDIVSNAALTNTTVVLSSVAVNLTDCPPFASLEGSIEDSSKEELWKSQYELGEKSYLSGEYDTALNAITKAIEINSSHANSHYILGKIHLAADRVELAGKSFERARDLDGLRFRADTRINRIARQLGDGGESDVIFVDLAESFASVEMNGQKGLYYDHVHLSFEGNYKVAADMAKAILLKEGASDAAIPSIERVKEKIAYTDWDAIQIQEKLVNDVMDKPPFTNQLGYAASRLRNKRAIKAAKESFGVEGINQSEEAYRKALASSPKDAGLLFRYARLLSSQDRTKEAIEVAHKIVEENPHHYEALLELSTLYSKLNRFEEAEDYVNRILEINPHAIEPRWQLLYSKGELSEVERYNRSLVEDHPQDPDLRFAYSLVLKKLGRNVEAMNQLRKAISIDPSHAGARSQLVEFLRGERRLDQALREAERWIKADPVSAEASFTMAETLDMKRDFKRSSGYYRMTLERDPDHYVARSRYVQLMAQQGRLKEAIDYQESQLEDDPEIAQGFELLGLALDVAGRKREAIEAFRNGLERNPRSLKCMRELAWMLSTSKSARYRDGDEAVRLAERLVAQSPAEADFRNVLAAAYAEVGEFEQAIAEAEKGLGLARQQNQKEAYDILSQCLSGYKKRLPLRVN